MLFAFFGFAPSSLDEFLSCACWFAIEAICAAGCAEFVEAFLESLAEFVWCGLELFQGGFCLRGGLAWRDDGGGGGCAGVVV